MGDGFFEGTHQESRDYLEVATNLSEENTEMQRAMLELLEEIRELTDEKFPGKDLDAFASCFQSNGVPVKELLPTFPSQISVTSKTFSHSCTFEAGVLQMMA